MAPGIAGVASEPGAPLREGAQGTGGYGTTETRAETAEVPVAVSGWGRREGQARGVEFGGAAGRRAGPAPLLQLNSQSPAAPAAAPPACLQTTTTATTGAEGASCGAQYFTKTEDRPVVKERVEYVQEHRPVEKEFVVGARA